MLSEAAQSDSGPEIGTPAWINPTRCPVIKQPGVFLHHSDGRGDQERERQRGRVAENGCNQMAAGPVCLRYDLSSAAYRPDIKQFVREGGRDPLLLQRWPREQIAAAAFVWSARRRAAADNDTCNDNDQ